MSWTAQEVHTVGLATFSDLTKRKSDLGSIIEARRESVSLTEGSP